MATSELPTRDDVIAAAARIGAHILPTPLIEHPVLNRLTGGRILLKAESLQRTGSFKFRGALNAISQSDREAYPGGVVATSSGNHAQGVAAAAALCNVPAAIVMPSDAPPLKIERTRAFGAEVILYDRASEDRVAIAQDVCASRQADFVHPFDDPRVMAGQGTVGLEIVEQSAASDASPDQVLVCCAGGGLLSGITLAVKAASPQTTVHPVEPAGFDDFARSLAAGVRQQNTQRAGSLCDALLVEQPGELTFAVAKRHCSSGIVVTDAEACDAVRFAFRELKLVLEPGGAVALAAVLTGKVETAGKTIVCVLSGGNADPAIYAKILSE
ncbi:MAG: threonine/serine dehydratase [Pseudomonadota bacterium]